MQSDTASTRFPPNGLCGPPISAMQAMADRQAAQHLAEETAEAAAQRQVRRGRYILGEECAACV